MQNQHQRKLLSLIWRLPAVFLIGFIIWVGMAQVNPLVAQTQRDLDTFEDPDYEPTEEEIFREAKFKFPFPPKRENFARLEDGYIANDLKYYVDKVSIILGSDGVMRYTSIIEGKNGITTVFYEGIRCTSGEVKVLGYLNSKRKFLPMKNATWQYPARKGTYSHRDLLLKSVMCTPEYQPAGRDRALRWLQTRTESGAQITRPARPGNDTEMEYYPRPN